MVFLYMYKLYVNDATNDTFDWPADVLASITSVGNSFHQLCNYFLAHLSEKIHECGEDYWIGSIEDPENGIYYRLAYKDWILLLHNNWNPSK
jgi:hypothetical protein